jgi:uncharacterized membrane protein
MPANEIARRARPATPRFDDIDVLRGLSILAVGLLHIYLRLYFVGISVCPMLRLTFSVKRE